MVSDGFQAQKRGSWIEATERRVLAKANSVDGRKEWMCEFCSESNVWTRWSCRRCDRNIPAGLQGKCMQAVAAKSGRGLLAHQRRVENMELRARIDGEGGNVSNRQIHSQRKDPAGSEKVERKEWKRKKKKEEKREAQKKPLVDKAQRTIGEPICVRKERRRCEGERDEEEQESQGETISGKIWKMALPSLDFDAELGVCRCCSREVEDKRGSRSDGNHQRVGCGGRHSCGPGWRKPSGGTEGKAPERVEAVKGVDRSEMRKEEKD